MREVKYDGITLYKVESDERGREQWAAYTKDVTPKGHNSLMGTVCSVCRCCYFREEEPRVVFRTTEPLAKIMEIHLAKERCVPIFKDGVLWGNWYTMDLTQHLIEERVKVEDVDVLRLLTKEVYPERGYAPYIYTQVIKELSKAS